MRLDEADSYIKSNFEIHQLAVNRFMSHDQNILSRTRNRLVNAIKQRKALPKIILVVLEDDVIKYFKHQKPPSTSIKTYQKALKWLMNEFYRVIAAFKDILPLRAKCGKWPHTLWMVPSTNVNYHCNNIRLEFAEAMKTAVKLYPDMSTGGFEQIWSYNDGNLALYEQRRLTNQGIVQLWRAIDRTVRYCDTTKFKTIARNVSDALQSNNKPTSTAESTSERGRGRGKTSAKRGRGFYRRQCGGRWAFNRPSVHDRLGKISHHQNDDELDGVDSQNDHLSDYPSENEEEIPPRRKLPSPSRTQPEEDSDGDLILDLNED